LQTELETMRNESNDVDTDDIKLKDAEVKAMTYSYRSYNPKSLKLYAERYPGYVASLPYIITTRRTAVTRRLTRQHDSPSTRPSEQPH